MSISNYVDPPERWHIDAREICRVPNVCRDEKVLARLGCGEMCPEILIEGIYGRVEGAVKHRYVPTNMTVVAAFDAWYTRPYNKYVRDRKLNVPLFKARVFLNPKTPV
jgi:hypothetical protein